MQPGIGAAKANIDPWHLSIGKTPFYGAFKIYMPVVTETFKFFGNRFRNKSNQLLQIGFVACEFYIKCVVIFFQAGITGNIEVSVFYL